MEEEEQGDGGRGQDAVAAHLSAERNINEHEEANPWQAAYASAAAFTIGAILPLIAILLPPAGFR